MLQRHLDWIILSQVLVSLLVSSCVSFLKLITGTLMAATLLSDIFLMEGVQYEKRVAEKDNQMRLYLSSSLKPIGISHPAPVEELEEITDIVHKKPKVEHCK